MVRTNLEKKNCMLGSEKVSATTLRTESVNSRQMHFYLVLEARLLLRTRAACATWGVLERNKLDRHFVYAPTAYVAQAGEETRTQDDLYLG